MFDTTCVLDAHAVCAESPIWHPELHRLLWVDIAGMTLNSFNPSTGENVRHSMKEEVGSIAIREDGSIVAGMRSGFAFIELDSATVDYIADPEPDLPQNRLNDGKCDRAGRFWVGSMYLPKDARQSSLYRLEGDRSWKKFAGDLIVSNGLGFSPDGRTMYHSDSRQSTIWRYDYDSTDGVPTNKRIFAVLRPEQGRPDGATVDADGFYWSCCYSGGRIIRFAPDGTIDREIAMPAKNVTMCAFGGSSYDTLFVTTASEHMSEEELRQYPLAGGIFAMNVGVRGLADARFKG